VDALGHNVDVLLVAANRQQIFADALRGVHSDWTC
jgi:hypothetical protein